MYDVAIVGSGIGGMTAAIYAARAGLSHVMIEKEPFPGGQIIKTAEVDNFPGFERISGTELAMKVKVQCDKAGVQTLEGEVVGIGRIGEEEFLLKLGNGKTVVSENIILAVGAKPRLLGVPGESEFTGRGVSYCATCDGPLYRNKRVVVFGGGDSALRTVLYMSGIADKVTLVHRRNDFRADKPLVDKAKELQVVSIITDTVPESIVGDDLVSGVNIRNVKTGESSFIECDGVFVAVGNEPDTVFFSGTEKIESDSGVFCQAVKYDEQNEKLVYVKTDKKGYIVAGEDCKTSVEGIYAVGDCRNGRLKQLVTAAADGAVAVSEIKAGKDLKK